MNKALFLDRDGIINVEKNYVYKIEDFEFIHGIFDLCRFYQDLGFLLVVITNQAGIGRGYYSEEDYHLLTDWMLSEFVSRDVPISKVFFCPHHPVNGVGQYRFPCECRKPGPKMILDAKREFDIDLEKSMLIGDKESDIEAGINAGIRTNILIDNNSKEKSFNTKANYIIHNIADLKSLSKLEPEHN